MPTSQDPRDHLPLTAAVYHILLALVEDPRHGYAILKEVELRSAGKVMLSTGTLYAAIKRLLSGGLIEETSAPSKAESDDARRRYYALTPLGRRVARAETERMASLVALAAARDLVPAPEGSAGGADA
jgi:DNA-binding PadR family transcriptional regulator